MKATPKNVLIDQATIQARVAALGQEIAAAYRGEELHAIVVLRGAVIFAADLIRRIDLPVTVDFMAVSSYGQSTRSSGVVRILKDLEDDVADRHVLLIEDIVDTGLTLRYLLDHLQGKRPRSLSVCALLDKTPRRLVPVEVPYVGFQIPDAFVVGYGLDYDGHFRNLPDIVVLEVTE